jgi:uncharacterized protein (DUF779 family)
MELSPFGSTSLLSVTYISRYKVWETSGKLIIPSAKKRGGTTSLGRGDLTPYPTRSTVGTDRHRYEATSIHEP